MLLLLFNFHFTRTRKAVSILVSSPLQIIYFLDLYIISQSQPVVVVYRADILLVFPLLTEYPVLYRAPTVQKKTVESNQINHSFCDLHCCMHSYIFWKVYVRLFYMYKVALMQKYKWGIRRKSYLFLLCVFRCVFSKRLSVSLFLRLPTFPSPSCDAIRAYCQIYWLQPIIVQLLLKHLWVCNSFGGT